MLFLRLPNDEKGGNLMKKGQVSVMDMAKVLGLNQLFPRVVCNCSGQMLSSKSIGPCLLMNAERFYVHFYT